MFIPWILYYTHIKHVIVLHGYIDYEILYFINEKALEKGIKPNRNKFARYGTNRMP